MKVLLISTADFQNNRESHLKRLLQSVAASTPAREGSLLHLLLCQRASSNDVAALSEQFRFVDVRTVPDRVPLSHARNLLLSAPRAAAILAKDGVVAFPDDDAWYVPDFFERMLGMFARENAWFFFCRYASSPRGWSSQDQAVPPSFREVVSHASSNTMVLRNKLARTIGLFDEHLGLGTNAGSGEDTDYAIKAFCTSPKTVWINAPLVGHRDASKTLRRNYFAGDLLVLARHARTNAAAAGLFLRKTAIGGYYMATGQMSAAELTRASAAAIGALFRNRSAS